MNHSTGDDPAHRPTADSGPLDSPPEGAPEPEPVSRRPGRYQWTVAILSGVALTLVALTISKYSVATSIGLGIAAVVVSHLIQAVNRGR